jgi:hypothetical protein
MRTDTAKIYQHWMYRSSAEVSGGSSRSPVLTNIWSPPESCSILNDQSFALFRFFRMLQTAFHFNPDASKTLQNLNVPKTPRKKNPEYGPADPDVRTKQIPSCRPVLC